MSRSLARALGVVSVLLLSDQLRHASAQATPEPSQGLHALFVASGKLYFGNAMDVNVFNDTAYQAIASNKNEFGMVCQLLFMDINQTTQQQNRAPTNHQNGSGNTRKLSKMGPYRTNPRQL